MRLVQCCVKLHFIVSSIGYYKAEDCVKVRSKNIPSFLKTFPYWSLEIANMRLNKRQTFRMAQSRQPTILPLDISNIYPFDSYQAYNYEVQSKLAVALQDTCKSLSQTVIYKRCKVLNKKCTRRNTKTFTFCTVWAISRGIRTGALISAKCFRACFIRRTGNITTQTFFYV